MIFELIQVNNVSYSYPSQYDNENMPEALKDLNVGVRKGEFVAVIGRNGSGKSTFARLLNALILPSKGTVCICGMNTANTNEVWEIRKKVGIVFQNPDNQIISTIVEEDAAFGPENQGLPPLEVRRRVDYGLKAVNMYEYRHHAPHLLSGGQKQRIAIAGILAMKPDCIVLDEATAMLDPIGRKEVISIVRQLNQEEGMSVIHITHHMDEAVFANRVIVMDYGKVVMEGTPREVFSRVEELKKLGLEVPQVTQLVHELIKEGYYLPPDIISVDEAFKHILRLMENE